jgi:DNA-binding beta-propeller fold protein YncE
MAAEKRFGRRNRLPHRAMSCWLAVVAQAVSPACLLAAQTVTRYEEVKDWPKLPAGVQLGETAGVAVDRNGHVFVFHRPGRGFAPSETTKLTDATVLEIDAETGKLISSWGADTFLVPHGISIDRENNIFLTDVGLQQVFKFTHDGKLIFALGEPRVGAWDATHFNQPTDIAIRADGSFYVSDGYINSRVALFDRDGKWVREWGKKGSGEGEFCWCPARPTFSSPTAKTRVSNCSTGRGGSSASGRVQRMRQPRGDCLASTPMPRASFTSASAAPITTLYIPA